MSLEALLQEPSLQDRVVLITGGARGLGWVMAEALLKAGARVVVTAARNMHELRDVEAKAVALVGPGRFVAMKSDVTNEANCREVVGATLRQFGDCHVLINNAARGPAEARPDYPGNPPKLWEVSSDAWRTIIETNVTGPFIMTQAIMPHFHEKNFGRVINISTSLPNMTRAGNAGYGPSKAALEVVSVQWAHDLADTGITVNVLLPGGPTDTALIPGGEIGQRHIEKDSYLLAPDVMIAPTLWLCSDLSNGVTGKRYIGKDWDTTKPIDEGEAGSRQATHDAPVIM